MNQNQGNHERKAYSKPEVRRIELKPEESLAAGCKVITTTQTGATTARPCEVMSCIDQGS